MEGSRFTSAQCRVRVCIVCSGGPGTRCTGPTSYHRVPEQETCGNFGRRKREKRERERTTSLLFGAETDDKCRSCQSGISLDRFYRGSIARCRPFDSQMGSAEELTAMSHD